MNNINVVMSQLDRKFLGGRKIPHGISNPVLRKYEGRYVIAIFFYIYRKEHLDMKQLPRPKDWMVADIETGGLIREISCDENDFSKQSFEKLYSTDNTDIVKPSPGHFEEIFKLFDEIRKTEIESGEIDTKKYSQYMEKMISLVPPAYRIFYEELSDVTLIN